MSLFIPGENCWRVVQADRAAYLIDSQRYYSVVKKAIEQANRSVFIVGWDIDSRMQLIRDRDRVESNHRLSTLLDSAVAGNPELEIRILVWDYALIKVMEREFLLSYKLGWKTHPRLIFRWDHTHPLGASHHQKIVVIDDQLAFIGGIDLSKWRWDTPQHEAGDIRRTDPQGKPYKPYHDVQMMVGGEAASALGDLARGGGSGQPGNLLQLPVEMTIRTGHPISDLIFKILRWLSLEQCRIINRSRKYGKSSDSTWILFGKRKTASISKTNTPPVTGSAQL